MLVRCQPILEAKPWAWMIYKNKRVKASSSDGQLCPSGALLAQYQAVKSNMPICQGKITFNSLN